MQKLDKGHTAQDIRRAFALTEQAGINLRPSLLPFTPWETLESYNTLLDFFAEEHLIEQIDLVHLSIRLLVPPGSALLDDPESLAWQEELDAGAYTYRWHHPDPRMDRLQQRIAQIVEQEELCKVDKVATFFSIQQLVREAQGKEFSPEEAQERYGQKRVLPHLTESWFC